MVVSPEEAVALTEEQEKSLKKLETLIDKWLVGEMMKDRKELWLPAHFNSEDSKFVGASSKMGEKYFPKDIEVERKVLDPLINQYREKGWKIKEKVETEGKYIYFQFKYSKPKKK